MRQIKCVMRPVSKEFRKEKCGFEHTPPDDFFKSQWQTRTKSNFYLIYRWIMAIFFIGVVTESLVSTYDDYYFIYLTNWGIIMCMLTNLYGGILVSLWHYHPEYSKNLIGQNSITSPFKIYWGMHVITLVLSIVITIVYWTILYDDSVPMTVTNVLTHASNAIFMFLDLIIVAYPIRLLHVFLPLSFGLSYALFSVIYNALGGVDGKGNPYVYNVLDWNHPENAMVTVVGVLFLTCFVYMLIFTVYRIRIFVAKRIARSSLILPTSATSLGPTSSTVIMHSPSGISMALGSYKGEENPAYVEGNGDVQKV